MAADPTGPADTLHAYARALEDGRATDAYRLLSAEAKRTLSLEAFSRTLRENPDDVREIARSLARPTSPPVVTALVHSPTGEELELVFENGVWTIDGAAIDRYGQNSPRQALLGFLRAFDRQRFEVILRYVPKGGLAAASRSPPSSSKPRGQARRKSKSTRLFRRSRPLPRQPRSRRPKTEQP